MRRLLPLLIAGGVLALPAAASADATVSVAAAPAFTPAEVSVQAGQKVTWDFNGANGVHNIVVLPAGAPFPAAAPSGANADYDFPADGKTFAKTFASAGTFRYLCTFHYFPGAGLEMKGTVTVTGAAPPPPPPASLPPEPIAVASDRTAPFTAEIFTLTGSESTAKRLTTIGGEESEPAWSYDAAHRRIAWQRLLGPDAHILVMDADGTDQVDVMPAARSLNVEPSWSPDSSQIAFTSTRSGNGDVYVMEADGSSVRRLTSDPAADRHPTWAPDGRHIAFASDRTGVSRIWIMDVDPAAAGEGTNLRQMTTAFPLAQTEPEFSPVANRIAYVQLRGSAPDPDPGVFDVETGTHLGFVTGNGAIDDSPTWSPDGTRIIWSRFANGRRDLFIHGANDSGSESALTTLDDAVSYAAPAWQPAAKPVKPPPAPKPAPGGTGGGTAPGDEPEDTRPDPGTAPAPGAFLGLDVPHRTTVKAFRTLGLPVVARCTGLAKGTARLGVSRKVARRLGLASRTLAKGTATCGADKRASVLLKPVKRVRKALARGKARTAIRRARGLDATLAVVFTGDGAKLTDTLAIRLAR